jgi:hypothetical protein
MFRFVFLFILFFGLFSCVKTETTKISNDVKIVKYLFSDDKEKSIIKKYNKEFGQWFEVSCSISELKLAKECIDNLEYTKLAKSKMNLLIQNQGNDNETVQTTNSQTEENQNIQTEQPSEPELPPEPEECSDPSEC